MTRRTKFALNWRLTFGLCFACLLAASLAPVSAQDKKTSFPLEPEVRSIYPLGAQPGTSVQAEIRGRGLDGCYALWFSASGLTAEVQALTAVASAEPEDDSSEDQPEQGWQRLSVLLEVDTRALLGEYHIRLVTPDGVSNPLRFLVTRYPSIKEEDAAELVPLPGAINGRISKNGEEDLYAFRASGGQKVDFEVVYDPGPPRIPGKPAPKTIDPELTLYAASGSWFDPKRPVRLAFNDEPSSPRVSQAPRLTYRFANSGNYLIKIGSFKGLGSPDYCYQLRMGPGAEGGLSEAVAPIQTREPDHEEPEWKERDFARVLRPNRLEKLRARTVAEEKVEACKTSPGRGSTSAFQERPGQDEPSRGSPDNLIPAPVRETPSNDRLARALEVTPPVVIEGAIEHPGDVDSFKFQVETGERMAFEIETAESSPPQFNPRLGVFDQDGREFLTNIYKRISRNGQFYLKTVEPKTVYTFRLGGEHFLQIRDVTSRYGDPSFRYRLLIRPQVPHVGEIQVQADRVNLRRGEACKVTVTTDQEEGFAGDIAVTLEGLPDGVQLVPATQVEPDKGPPLDEGEKERFVPKNQKAILMLLASRAAPLTPMPLLVGVSARVVIDGRLGLPLPVKRIPMMVVRSARESSAP